MKPTLASSAWAPSTWHSTWGWTQRPSEHSTSYPVQWMVGFGEVTGLNLGPPNVQQSRGVQGHAPPETFLLWNPHPHPPFRVRFRQCKHEPEKGGLTEPIKHCPPPPPPFLPQTAPLRNIWTLTMNVNWYSGLDVSEQFLYLHTIISAVFPRRKQVHVSDWLTQQVQDSPRSTAALPVDQTATDGQEQNRYWTVKF